MAANSDQMTKSLDKQLIEAVEITLNPVVDQQLRKNAFQYIETFKQESPVCVEVGLSLFNKDNSPIVRHLGLQLLEHSIKFRWNTMTSLQQEELKCTCLELIANGTKPVLEEHLHIKESLARLVVEIIKREWPQKWETLLQDLTVLCNMGETQTELTLMVFLRMAEDIISMDSHLHQHRKRDITQALQLHMEGLFTFFIKTLRTNTTNMIELRKNPPSAVSQSQVLLHQRIAEQTLLTLQGFLDWVKFNIIFIEDCIVPQMLCLLLNEEELRIPACECLLMIVSRKGKFDQKQEYSRLFSQDALQFMQTAARKACEAEYDEKHYLFLKRLCQVFTTLGSVQLIQMWSKERPESKPETFQQYLETILIFSRHNSLALTHLTNSLWLVILRNDIMVIDKDVKSVIPILLQLAKTKILRVGDPDSSDDSSDFNREDFDNTKEFDSVFTQMRSQVMDIIKIITLQFPVETFFEAADWLLENVEKTKLGIQSVSALQQLKTQWEGMCCYITAVMARLFVVENIKDLLNNKMMMRGKCVTMLDVARNCIQSLLIMTCNDPSILGNVADILHCLSSFLTHAQDFILDVLKKIFSLVTYNTTGKPEAPWTVDVLHTRRRACSALLQMCTEYGNLLVPMFDELKHYVQSLFEGEVVTIQDRTTLTEALVIASNFIGSSLQNVFIASLLNPHKELLIDNRDSISVEWLIVYLQLNKDPASYTDAHTRSKLILALTTILAVVKRCCSCQLTETKTSHSDRCSIGLMPDGASAHSPCSSHVLPYLPSLLILTQAINNLYGPTARALMFPAYIPSLDMHDSEKTAIFALQNNADGERAMEDNSAVTKTKRYIFHLTDSCYSTLGHVGNAIGGELYSQPGLAQFINEHVISTLQHLPNYRLRIVIRHFIKPFIIHCPPEYYETTLVPVLAHFFTFMFQHLQDEWQSVKSHQSESAAQKCQDQQDTYSKEVIDDQLVHIVTKDYIDVFFLACTFKTKKLTQVEEETEKVKEGMEAVLGPLGEILIQSVSVNMQLLTTVFASMTWLDSTACSKASRLSVAFVKKALTMAQSMGSAISTNVIEALYLQILMGFQIHDEAAQSMLLRVGCVLYELLRMQYPSLKQVVLQVTGCQAELETFEEMLFGSKPRSDKSKRDQFKRIVENILGKHLGELFKDEIKIKDLPAIKLPKKPSAIVDDEQSLGLAELFDPKNATELI